MVSSGSSSPSWDAPARMGAGFRFCAVTGSVWLSWDEGYHGEITAACMDGIAAHPGRRGQQPLCSPRSCANPCMMRPAGADKERGQNSSWSLGTHLNFICLVSASWRLQAFIFSFPVAREKKNSQEEKSPSCMQSMILK